MGSTFWGGPDEDMREGNFALYLLVLALVRLSFCGFRILFLILKPKYQGFHCRQKTNSSPGVLQVSTPDWDC